MLLAPDNDSANWLSKALVGATLMSSDTGTSLEHSRFTIRTLSGGLLESSRSLSEYPIANAALRAAFFIPSTQNLRPEHH